jgi:aspartate aminotransferase
MKDLEFSGTIRVLEKVQEMSRRGIKVTNFGGGTLDDTPLFVKHATKKSIDDGLGSGLTNTLGLLELREAVAQDLAQKDGLRVDPESQVIITVGAKNGIIEAIQATIEPGEEVVVLDPCWPSYIPLIVLCGGVPKIVPMGKNKYFEVDANNIRRAIGSRTKMIIVNSPHNPTGRVFKKNELEAISNIAKEYDLYVVSDECYKDLVYDDNKHYSIASFPDMVDRTIVIYGFSKAFAMAGWRIGYVVANGEIIRKMMIIQSNTVSCPTTFAQKGAVAALKEGQDHLIHVVKAYQKLRDIAVEKLNEIKGVFCEKPEGAFWVFPNVSYISERSDQLSDYLLEHGRIATTPGSTFGDNAVEYLRIIYRHEEAYLRKGLEILKKKIEGYMNK